MNRNTIIVDLQGFKNYKNEFIVKEFVIASLAYTNIFVIKPPYSFSSLTDEEKKHVRWIERNRGYRWSDGYVDYKEFRRIIKPYLKNQKIIVKGEEKIKWVQELCDHENVIDISDQGLPNLKTLSELYINDNYVSNCLLHKKNCALKNVLCIKKWCLANKIAVCLL